MPARGRYAAKQLPADPSDYQRAIAIQDDPSLMYLAPGEAEFVKANTDENGLDPIEQEYRRGRGRQTDLERAIQLQRLLPHKSTVTPQMAAVHDRRFSLWTQGFSTTEISDLEDVDYKAVARSITYCLSRVPADEILRLKNSHLALNTHLEHTDKFQAALERQLTSDKDWSIDRGMTHFERIVGITGGGINVNVDARKQSAHFHAAGEPGNGPISFEEAFDVVRAELASEFRVELPTADELAIDADIITQAEPGSTK